MVNTTVARADSLKVQTADALEEAARKLREADLSARGADVKAALNDAEARINRLRDDFSERVEPVETFIVEHPIMSVAMAVGLGFLVGALVSRRD